MGDNAWRWGIRRQARTKHHSIKGIHTIVKRGSRSPRGYGARFRDRAYDEFLYAYRSVGEGIFGALTVEFGDRLKTRREKSTKTRTLLRIVIYCLKILVRWAYE